MKCTAVIVETCEKFILRAERKTLMKGIKTDELGVGSRKRGEKHGVEHARKHQRKRDHTHSRLQRFAQFALLYRLIY